MLKQIGRKRVRVVEITDEILETAMKKSVELGIFPEEVSLPTYLHNWNILEEILKAVLEEIEDD
jgi:hypothetical protein